MYDARKIFDRRMLIILLVLLTLAGLSQWLLNLNEAPSATSRPDRGPDYTMDNFTATAMGAAGNPENRLQATHMAHYPTDGSTQFTKPHITVFRTDHAPWHIHAERGWMGADRKLVLLRGDVLIENPAAPKARVARLTTRNLRVLIDEEYAETDQPVTLRTQSSVTHAIGMRAYLKEGRLQLLSQVRGTYAPKKAPRKKR